MFAAPGLKPRARLWGLLAIPAITLFFAAGMLFAYYAMLPTALPFLVDFMGIRTCAPPLDIFSFRHRADVLDWHNLSVPLGHLRPGRYRPGLAQTLLKQSRLAVVILAVIAAAITPTIDPISMLLVWGPLVLLYFLGVGLAMIAQRRRQPRLEAAPPASKSGRN